VINLLKQLESQEPELVTLRSENRVLAMRGELRDKELGELRKGYERLLEVQQQMSAVKSEYRLQSAERDLWSENQRAKLQAQEVTMRLREVTMEL